MATLSFVTDGMAILTIVLCVPSVNMTLIGKALGGIAKATNFLPSRSKRSQLGNGE